MVCITYQQDLFKTTVGRIRPFPNRVENFIEVFNSMRPSAIDAASSLQQIVLAGGKVPFALANFSSSKRRPIISCRRFSPPQSLMLNGGLARMKSALRSGCKSVRKPRPRQSPPGRAPLYPVLLQLGAGTACSAAAHNSASKSRAERLACFCLFPFAIQNAGIVGRRPAFAMGKRRTAAWPKHPRSAGFRPSAFGFRISFGFLISAFGFFLIRVHPCPSVSTCRAVTCEGGSVVKKISLRPWRLCVDSPARNSKLKFDKFRTCATFSAVTGGQSSQKRECGPGILFFDIAGPKQSGGK